MSDMPMKIWAHRRTPEDKGDLWHDHDFWGGDVYINAEQLAEKIRGMRKSNKQFGTDLPENTVWGAHNAALDEVLKMLEE
jgi:hypothetical protein